MVTTWPLSFTRFLGQYRRADGAVEAIRVLVVAKRSARQARTKALIQMRHIGYTAPEQLAVPPQRAFCAGSCRRGDQGAADPFTDSVTAATKASLSSLAHRIEALEQRARRARQQDRRASGATVPDLLELFGVGPDTAAALVMAAGDDPERLHSEGAWVHLCDVAPVPAGSGKTNGKVKAHDGGDRQANSALWRIVMVRIAHDPETQLLLRASSQGGQDQGRGHPHLEALRRPRGLSLPASAAGSSGCGSGFPPYCRSSELTLQRLADPQLGPTISKTRDPIGACPHLE